jgi:hypothetical protein
MSSPLKIDSSKSESQPDQWPYSPITVDLRSPGPGVNPAVAGFATVTIPLGPHGAIVISGFSVLSANGHPPHVVPPARKGNSRYFDIVTLSGDIRRLIEQAVLAAFIRQKRSPGEGS